MTGSLDHRSFVAQIDPQTRAGLTEQNDRPALIRLAFHFGLITILAAAILTGLGFWFLAVPILGVLLAFLFTLQHECTHKTPFRSNWLNEWIGHVTGAILVQPFLAFRYFHLAHHKFTNDPENDPELAGDPKPENMTALAYHLSSIGYWRDKIRLLASHAYGDITQPYFPDHTIPKLRREARWLIAIYALFIPLLLTTPRLFWIWPGPLLFGFPVLRLYLLAEHGRCPKVANMFDNTRTTLTNSAVRLIAWNMPYHAEHHIFPAVPFHKLPELHRISAPHLKQVENGYRSFTKGYVENIRR